MWMDCDCEGTRKLINSDSVQSFDIMRNINDSEHEYRLEIQYANAFNVSSGGDDTYGGSVVEDDSIFQGTYEECKKYYDSIIDRICEADTMKPIVKLVEPDVYQAKPKNNMLIPEGTNDDSVTEDTETINFDKRVILFVKKANLPCKHNSEDMRGVRGGLITIKNVIRAMYSIREGEQDTIPDWYKEPGDMVYTISINMAKDSELKQYTNYGFVTLND